MFIKEKCDGMINDRVALTEDHRERTQKI